MRFLALLVLLFSSSRVFAQHDMGEDTGLALHITNVWAPPTLETGETYVYFSIENPTEHLLTLAGVTVDATADIVSGGETVEEVALGAGETVTFEEDGTVIVLTDLEESLNEGDAFSLTLNFAMADMEETMDVIVGVPVLEEAPAESPFIVVNPWVRPTVAETMDDATQEPTPEATPEMGGHEMASGVVTGAFMHIMNTGETADKLIGVSSDVAMMTEIHETTMVNDMMQMRPVEGGIEIPAGEALDLKPGSYHIMLMDVKEDLAPGDAILVTLIFESGLEQTIAIPVYDRSMMQMMGEM